jgi:hypothetical protein
MLFIRPRQTIVVACALVLLSSVSAKAYPPANAAQKANPSAGAGAGAASAIETTVVALRQARTLLETADHDYKGHRASAVKHVSHAIHLLLEEKKSIQGATHSGKASGGTASPAAKKVAAGAATPHVAKKVEGHMPQAASDAQLRVAMNQLAALQGQVAGLPGGAGAAASVQAALQELQVALTVK